MLPSQVGPRMLDAKGRKRSRRQRRKKRVVTWFAENWLALAAWITAIVALFR